MNNLLILPSVQANAELPFVLLQGDVKEQLATLADNSVDSIVTDPPYELGFMNKKWDATGIANDVTMWKECLRVLKPGGHLLSFGGSRTYHRMASSVEDAGFEIRDQIQWVYGSGFPKSMDVSKAFVKSLGAEREIVGTERNRGVTKADEGKHAFGDYKGEWNITKAASEEAKKWDGWGTALKPSCEPIVLARKPLEGTVVANIRKYGTGGLNIGACRVPGEPTPINKLEKWSGFGEEKRPDYTPTVNTEGRWPANLIHDGSDEVLAAFPNAKGQQGHSSDSQRSRKNVYGEPSDKGKEYTPRVELGKLAARFFYCAKANRTDRNEGCEKLEYKTAGETTDRKDGSAGLNSPRAGAGSPSGSLNHHPTVKPTELMRYLCRLITPPGGTVLDPFMGSGSTGKAAILENFKFIGIDNNGEYVSIAKARMEKVAS